MFLDSITVDQLAPAAGGQDPDPAHRRRGGSLGFCCAAGCIFPEKAPLIPFEEKEESL